MVIETVGDLITFLNTFDRGMPVQARLAGSYWSMPLKDTMFRVGTKLGSIDTRKEHDYLEVCTE